MASHCGVVSFVNNQLPQDDMSRLESSLCQGGDDTASCWRESATSIAWTYESHGSPLRIPFHVNEACAVAMDGRLDNRRELLVRLRHLLSCDAGQITDASIVAAAYLNWGIDALSQLVGDWSIVVWDRHLRRLLMAVDYPGIARPLYYRITSEGVTWSSELSTFNVFESPLNPNDEYLVAFLLGRAPSVSTAFAGVSSIQAGHCVVCHKGAVRSASHWLPDLQGSISYSRDDEYAEHFREIFLTAIKDRIEGEREIWAELSGGLDSSSIVCVADALSRQSRPLQSLQTVSYSLRLNTVQESDDDYHRAFVLKQIQRPNHVINDADHRLLYPDDDSHLLASPILHYSRVKAVSERLKSRGIRTLLRGEGGDIVMGSFPYYDNLADMLVQGRWLHMLRTAVAASQHSRRYSVWGFLRRDGIGPIVDGHSLPLDPLLESREPWINWQRATALWPRDQGPLHCPDSVRTCLPSRRRFNAQLNMLYGLMSPRELRSCGSIDATYPFLDRRIIQFMLAIPFNQRLRPGRTRYLHRSALSKILPKAIESRQTKGGMVDSMQFWVTQQWEAVQELLTDDARVADRGLVDLRMLRQYARSVRAGGRKVSSEFFRVLVIENWLRHIERNQISARKDVLPKIMAHKGGDIYEPARIRGARDHADG